MPQMPPCLEEPIFRKILVLPPLAATEVLACQQEALDIENVTPESERFLRTYHPCFIDAATAVYIYEHPEYAPIWVVHGTARSAAKWLRVAGQEVHVHHQSNMVPGGLSPNYMEDPIPHTINPRKLLSEDDLVSIRNLFPHVDGVRVHISGFITLLLLSDRYIAELLYERFPLTIGGLRVVISLLEMLPTATPAPAQWGDPTADKPNEFLLTSTCLGLRIRLPGANVDAITTATHGYVTLPSGLAAQAPLGKTVFLAGTNRIVGKITACYDEPSSVIPFPSGYRHDLSLITGENLPEMVPPLGLPKITGFCSPEQALSGQHQLFTARYNLRYKNHDVYEGTVIPVDVQEDLAESTQYIWDRDSRTVSRSLLWRTQDGDEVSVGGASGSVLCLGKPTDSEVQAVVFQNFQRTFPNSVAQAHNIQLNTQSMQDCYGYFTSKGGFFLPEEIRASAVCMNDKPEWVAGSWPRRTAPEILARTGEPV